MAKFVSTYPGKLILPDGTEVDNGGDVEISTDLAKNVGVKGWIDGELLVAKAAAKTEKAD